MYFTMCEQMCYSRKNRLAAVTDRVETLLLNSLWMTAEHFCASVTVNVNASSSGQNGRSRSSASVINALNDTRSTHKTIWCERTDHRSSLSFCLTSPFFQRLLCVLCRSPEEPFGTMVQDYLQTGVDALAVTKATVSKHWRSTPQWTVSYVCLLGV